MPLSDPTIAKILSDALERDSYGTVAARYGVNKADIWRAINKGYVSRALRRAVDPPRKRTRIIVEVSPEVRAWWDEKLEAGWTNQALFYSAIDAWYKFYPLIKFLQPIDQEETTP